jgi:hypothetical protein
MSTPLADLRKLVVFAKAHEVKPAVVRSKRQAARMRALDRLLGIKDPSWAVGDEYYELRTVDFVRRLAA